MNQNNSHAVLQENLKSLTRFMSRYWENGDDGHSLKQIFQKHGDPARKMWRSSLICYANRLTQDGDPQTGKLLGKIAAYYMPKQG